MRIECPLLHSRRNKAFGKSLRSYGGAGSVSVEIRDMPRALHRSIMREPVSAQLAPSHHGEMLAQADDLLALMGSASLDIVAQLANELCMSARGVGEWKVAEAAE